MIRESAGVSHGLWNQGDNACPSSVIWQECNKPNDGQCDGLLGWQPVERVIWAVAGLGDQGNAPVGGLLEIGAVIVVVGADHVAFNGSFPFVDRDRRGVLLESFLFRVWLAHQHDVDVWKTRRGGRAGEGFSRKHEVGRRVGGV